MNKSWSLLMRNRRALVQPVTAAAEEVCTGPEEQEGKGQG